MNITEFFNDWRVIFFIIFGYIYYNYFFHPRHIGPLRHIPGPPDLLWASIKHMAFQMGGDPGEHIRRIHAKYGPIAHVGMGIISVLDEESVKKIYTGSRIRKDSRFETFCGQVPNIFSTTDPKYHSLRKRLIAPIFNITSLKLMEEEIAEYGWKSMVRNITAKYESGVTRVDIYSLLLRSTLDVISHLVLGNCLNSIQDDTYNPSKLIEDIARSWVIKMLVPFLRRFKSQFHPTLVGTIRNSIEERKQGIKKNDILQQMLDAEDVETEKRFSETEAIEEGCVLLFAGTDTTGMSMNWLIYHLLKHNYYYDKLVDELVSNFPDVTSNILYEDCRHLSWLTAVIYENMRLMPAGAAFPTRCSPEGGITLHNHYIPAGTSIAAQPYSYQRSHELWDRPDDFFPERWIDAAAKGQEKLLQSRLLLFGGGVRSCVGKELAFMEMYVTIANLIRKFEWSLAPGATMTPHENFIVHAKEGKLLVDFKPRSH